MTDVAPFESLSAGERSPSWRLRFRLREWLARSLVLVPSLYIVGALALAEAVSALEGDHDLLGLRMDADTARTSLSAVAGGMIAFTGLVVSLAVLVVQFGASQYTPRLVSRFRRDPVVKHALGIFIAPAIYALVSLRIIGRDGSHVVPSLTVSLAVLLLIVAVLAFFVLVSRLLDLLRPRRVIAQIVEQATVAIDDVYPFALGKTPSLSLAPEAPVVPDVPAPTELPAASALPAPVPGTLTERLRHLSPAERVKGRAMWLGERMAGERGRHLASQLRGRLDRSRTASAQETSHS